MGGAGWFNLFRCEGSFTFYPQSNRQARRNIWGSTIGIYLKLVSLDTNSQSTFEENSLLLTLIGISYENKKNAYL